MSDNPTSRLSHWISSVSTRITESQAYQQARAKWDELDPQVRLIISGSVAAGVLIGGLLFLGSLATDVSTLRKNTITKRELVGLLRTANVELSRLKSVTGGTALEGAQVDWTGYLTGVATQNGLDPASVKVGAPKASQGTSTTEEFLVDLELRKVSIKQLLQFTAALDQGTLPVRLRNLKITTESPEGYLDSTLSLSGFKPKK